LVIVCNLHAQPSQDSRDKWHSSRSADEIPCRLIERGIRRCWARVAQAVRLTALATSQAIRGTEFADRCKMCHSVPGVAVGPGLTGGTLGMSKAHSMARAIWLRRDFTLSHSHAAPKSQQLGTRRVTACKYLQDLQCYSTETLPTFSVPVICDGMTRVCHSCRRLGNAHGSMPNPSNRLSSELEW